MSPLKSSRSLRLLTGFIILLAVAGIAVSLKTPAAHAQDYGGTGVAEIDTSGPGPIAQIATSVKNAAFGFFTTISNISANVVGWLIYLILYFVIFAFVSPLVALLTYFITIILQLNGNVMNTLAVQTGFQVTLAVANLGFVLGIIIIAIATILHRQTYGVKSLLWKLVLAAILVNFSLIIGGVIINAANSLTTVFLKPFPGGGNGVAGFTGFANALAGAFAPHRSFLVGLDKYSQSFTNTAAQGSASTLSQSAIGSQLAPLFSIFFAAAMSIVILITLAIFVLMLLMRYMWLTFLLIVMPIVWLFWIFPYTASHWKKWWHEFLRWTFFPPIVIFFLYLAVATAGQMSNDNAKGGPFDVSKGLSGLGYTPDPNTPPIISDISAYFGGAVNSVLGTAMQLVIVVGLAVGGLYAANKLSIDGAALGMKALTGVKNAAVGYAGRRGAQAGGSILNSRRMRERARDLQQPDRGLVSRYTGRLLQGAQQTLGPKLVERKAGAYGNLSSEQLRDRISTAEGEYGRQAVLAELLKKDPAKLRDYSREEQEKYFGKDKEEAFARNGNEKLFKEVRRRSGAELGDLDNEISGLEKEAFEAARSHDLIGADRASKQIEKKKKERVALVTKMVDEDSEAVAENFDSDDAMTEKRAKSKAKTGRVSANLDEESIKRMRDAIVTSMAEGFSSENAGSLVRAIAKKNNLPEFERYIKTLRDAEDAPSQKKFNDLREAFRKNIPLLRWFEKNTGKSLINHRDLFRLTDADIPAEAKPSRKSAARRGGASGGSAAPSGPAGPTLYDAYGREVKS